jgi:hypothetical protein
VIERKYGRLGGEDSDLARAAHDGALNALEKHTGSPGDVDDAIGRENTSKSWGMADDVRDKSRYASPLN